jgi:hypothetical protein
VVTSSLFAAGWSSLVARRAHNPKVVGSNPTPATRKSRSECLSDVSFTTQSLRWPSVGDHSSCGSSLELAIPALAERQRWPAVLAMDTALTSGTIPVTRFSSYGTAEARGRAVAAARAALGDAAAKTGNTSDGRDALVRSAIAELGMLAAG